LSWGNCARSFAGIFIGHGLNKLLDSATVSLDNPQQRKAL
jgi:hypothetical protein